MTKIEKFTEYVLNAFQNNKGRSSLYCFERAAYANIIAETIRMFHNKRPQSQILVVVKNYDKRLDVKNKLEDKGYTENNGYNVKIISEDYVKPEYVYTQKLVILLGVNNYTKLSIFTRTNNRFILSILTENINNHTEINNIRKELPDINTAGYAEFLNDDYVYSPVEEHRLGVVLDDDVAIKYNQFTEFINNAISTFGGIDVLEKCRVGDNINNISASEYCYNLAVSNGWSSGLNVQIDFQRKIDEIYNPNALKVYADNFYNFTRSRRDLVSDYYGKLEEILKIVEDNSDKQIIIVSLRGEFASDITEYINNHSNVCKCGDYHDCIDNSYAYDDNGNIITYKTGNRAGEPKVFGHQFQSTQNEKRFNSHLINVLSIKNASNVKLKTACDLVIFTSPMCADITDFKLRFKDVKCAINPTVIYVLYCVNTIETTKLDKVTTKNVQRNVINDNEKDVILDENLGSIIL